MTGGATVEELAFIVLVKGRVTGVGFRYSTLEFASERPSLKGYVRNVSRNEVEVFVQGQREDIDAMTAWLRSGPSWSRVDALEIMETRPDPTIDGFIIKDSWR